MSKHNDLIVLYGLAGDHMGDVQEMQGVDGTTFENPVRFIAVLPDKVTRLANHLNRIGLVPYSFYFAYRLWHRSAYEVAKSILGQEDVDVVHYLCPIGFREPGYLWKLERPYIWGPIGGIDPRPARAFFGLGVAAGLKTVLRNAVSALQFRVSPRLARAIRRADVLLVITEATANLVRDAYGRLPIVMPENGVTATVRASRAQHKNGPLRLIWVGRVDRNKALDVLLRALARIKDKNWTLDVVGDGPMAPIFRQLTGKLDIERKTFWAGKVDRDRALELFSGAHVHVLTSLAEAHSTVLWEAMSFGVPTIAFDHCGMHDSICEKCGIRIPLGVLGDMERQLTWAIDALINDRDRVAELSRGATACAHQADWSHRTDKWHAVYELAEQNWLQAHG